MSVRRQILASLILLLCPLVLAAQPTGGVTGTVISRADRIPVAGAAVTLFLEASEVASATTDENGRDVRPARAGGAVP